VLRISKELIRAVNALVSDVSGNSEKLGFVLNEVGRSVDCEISSALNARLTKISSIPRFYSFCMAEALAWAEYAVRSTEYYDNTTKFFDGRIDKSQVDWASFAGRYGPEALRGAAVAYQEFKNLVPKRVAEGTSSSAELLSFQNSALVRAIDLSKRGWLRDFGSWLFCGPFKIAAILKPAIWDERALQSVYMPIGVHVAHGFKKLVQLKVADIDTNLLRERESGLAHGGFTTLLIAHKFQADMARGCQGSILHLNTGLHVLGGGTACTKT
jgi:hypothetical protein